jgi:hypothetical protein
MRTVTTFTALFLLTGCATAPLAESDLPGLYELVSVGGEAEPAEEGSAWLLEITPRGTWYMFDEDQPWLFDTERVAWEHLPGPPRNRGWFSVEGKKDGCTQLSFTFVADPAYVFRGNSCDGELTLLDIVQPPYALADLTGPPTPPGFPAEGSRPVTEVYRKRR